MTEIKYLLDKLSEKDHLIGLMKKYVYLRNTEDIGVYKIGRTSQNDPKHRAEVNKNMPSCILKTYNNYDCELYLKKIFKEKFELVRGHEYFRGDLDEMCEVFNICVIKFNREYKNKYIGSKKKDLVIEEYKKDLVIEEYKKDLVIEEYKKDLVIEEYKKKITIEEYKKDLVIEKYKKKLAIEEYKKKYIKGNDKEYKCDLCETIFKRKQHLIQHLNRKKSCLNKDLYKCANCYKSFSRQDNLNRHMNITCIKKKQ